LCKVGFKYQTIEKGDFVRFFTAEMLLKVLGQAKKDKGLWRRVHALNKFQLLIIDEFG
jgi:DNA replication protein DnaC